MEVKYHIVSCKGCFGFGIYFLGFDDAARKNKRRATQSGDGGSMEYSSHA